MSFTQMRPMKYVAVFLLASLLAACGGKVAFVKKMQSHTKLAPDQGIVIVRIVDTSGFVLPWNHVDLTPENFQSNKKAKIQRLTNNQASRQGGSTFASPIKAGHYRLSGMRAYHVNGDTHYSRYVNANSELGTFEVKAGAITDLGTLVFYEKPDGDRYHEMLTKIPDSNNNVALNAEFPFLKSNNMEKLTWKESGLEEQEQDNFIGIARNPNHYTKKYISPTGNLILLRPLGILQIRYANGDWDTLSLDTEAELIDVAQNETGDILVGGVHGTIFYKPADGEWQDLSMDGNRTVLNVYFTESGMAEVIYTLEHKLVVERADLSRSKQWQWAASYSKRTNKWENQFSQALKQKEEAEEKDLLLQMNEDEKQDYFRKKRKAERRQKKIEKSIRVRSRLNNKIFAVKRHKIAGKDAIKLELTNRPYAISEMFNQFERLDFIFNPNTWEVRNLRKSEKSELKNLHSKQEFIGGSKQVLRKEYSFALLSDKVEWSVKGVQDGWNLMARLADTCHSEVSDAIGCYKKESKARTPRSRLTRYNQSKFTFLGSPWFSSSFNGWALVRFNSDISTDEELGKRVRFINTTDGGKTWKLTSIKRPNKYCFDFFSFSPNKWVMGCTGVSADMYESDDLGKTWQHVLEQEDF